MFHVTDGIIACSGLTLTATYPYDCTQFYDCTDELDPQIISCSEGFVFSETYQRCVRPELSSCAGVDGAGKFEFNVFTKVHFDSTVSVKCSNS